MAEVEYLVLALVAVPLAMFPSPSDGHHPAASGDTLSDKKPSLLMNGRYRHQERIKGVSPKFPVAQDD
jgi:hypothetical protein